MTTKTEHFKYVFFPLTAADLKAMKSADKLGFHGANKSGQIIASRHVDADAMSGEISRIIETDCRIATFIDDEKWLIGEYTTASATVWPQVDDVMQTILSLLKVGDCLALDWSVDANRHLQDAGLAEDSLRLIVRRGDKSLTFNVKTQTTDVGSYSRLIQY